MTTVPTTPATDKPSSKTRIWSLRIPVRYESSSAPVFYATYEVSLSADAAGEITATVDGEAAPLRRATNLLVEAQQDGDLVLLHEEYHDTLDKAAARQLHADLGRIGIKSWAHYQLAASVVGREITSLTQVRVGEVDTILGTALLERGIRAI